MHYTLRCLHWCCHWLSIKEHCFYRSTLGYLLTSTNSPNLWFKQTFFWKLHCLSATQKAAPIFFMRALTNYQDCALSPNVRTQVGQPFFSEQGKVCTRTEHSKPSLEEEIQCVNTHLHAWMLLWLIWSSWWNSLKDRKLSEHDEESTREILREFERRKYGNRRLSVWS